MRYLFPLFLLLFVTGCQTAPVVQKVADVNDQSLESAELIMCKGASVGSVTRRYGNDVVLSRAWRDLCLDTNEGRIVGPVEDK